MRYFNFAAVMDLSDMGGNMMHGAHIASIGGTWLALVYGFAGMRDNDGRISFRPHLPDEWSRLSFPLAIQGNRLRVEIDRVATTYCLVEGERLTIHHDGEEIALTQAEPKFRRPTPLPAVEPAPEFAAGESAVDRNRPANSRHGRLACKRPVSALAMAAAVRHKRKSLDHDHCAPITILMYEVVLCDELTRRTLIEINAHEIQKHRTLRRIAARPKVAGRCNQSHLPDN